MDSQRSVRPAVIFLCRKKYFLPGKHDSNRLIKQPDFSFRIFTIKYFYVVFFLTLTMR